jgi:uncharacterized protein YlxP (DUF503 family)
VLACAFVSNSASHTQKTLQQIANWIETSWPDVMLVDDQIEII